VAFYKVKKTKLWIWKAYCRTTGELIDWELGDRTTETLWKLYERLLQFNVRVYYTDHWEGYSESVPPELMVQTKAETHGAERNNGQQRHWFARFRRRTYVVSRSIEMVDVIMALFAYFHSKLGKTKLFNLFSVSYVSQ
jgi:insertion element IS1 protein InsB